ncbi:sugar O-acetyltransferase [Nonomuraea sp. NN258]|uniref:sugar O-acetyltransferase n=1 Tax=Nonomuraea antri TaxID=2730852 RepID=UPI0015699956|nr:sugar O-acetyltransferase [Nonomuraea antri]NRQ38677.1 sugar O-acetyltransferase [Nonomuraea antri]
MGGGAANHRERPDYFAGDPRTNRERMLAGDLYIADDEESAAIARRAAELLETYRLQTLAGQDGLARETLTRVLGELGEGAVVRPPLFVDYGENLRIGARTFVNCNLTALDVAAITIGQDCQLGPGVQLLTPTHPVEPRPRRDKLESARPISVGDNVWLGGGVIVCPGVGIGDNSVVGAGAVVTRDIPANVVAAGNPARVIRPV